MRRVVLAWVGLAVSAAGGCGSDVMIEGAGGAGGAPPDPPLSPTCQSVLDGIDWSACEDLSYEPRRELGRYCENQTTQASCGAAAADYFQCLVAFHGVCVATVDPEIGSEGASVYVAECDGLQAAWSDCLAMCNEGSTCPESREVCECNGPTAHAGESCCWYPDCPEDGSVPSCFALCDSCQPVP